MAYTLTPISLDLNTDMTHTCHVHLSRDRHIIGIIEFHKAGYAFQWEDLEYMRRKTDEFSLIPAPEECIAAIVIDIRNVTPFIDQETPIIPWRLVDEECPIRLLIPSDRVEFYAGFFEPTWITSDLNTALAEIRTSLDNFMH
ncbi:hypothetical protein I2F27_09850 [Acinetobacter sp. B5B]|uniref:hypothetical protein n=1 Tax=Acinetobacter baretiae TaxID=2605383 RepID=UPI0018C22C98|nr:hypothetical protein [Acinetobacter baretiae]MBF7683624.1 hypothetical protein [Acinetobacter baretiae]MBF7686063.1 hypothetical protein [Acinetobacter baretiae]